MRDYSQEVDAALAEMGHGRPRSVYGDGWPGHLVPQIEVAGHVFAVTPTRMIGVDSGRTRYRVECITCGCVIHEATTGPRCRVAGHLMRSEVRP